MNFSTNFLSLTSSYNTQAPSISSNSSLTNLVSSFKSTTGINSQSNSVYGGIGETIFGDGLSGMKSLTGGLGTNLSIDLTANLSSLNFTNGLGTVNTDSTDLSSSSFSDLKSLTGGLGTNNTGDLDMSVATSSLFGKLGIGGSPYAQLSSSEMDAATPSFMSLVKNKLYA